MRVEGIAPLLASVEIVLGEMLRIAASCFVSTSFSVGLSLVLFVAPAILAGVRALSSGGPFIARYSLTPKPGHRSVASE